MGDVRIGCSGWNYPHWKRPVYQGRPAREWLGMYASMFSTVEVNSTFYRLPRRASVSAWAAATPGGFAFAVKGSRYLTHIKRLSQMGAGWSKLYERIEPLAQAGKLGPVLWQLPSNFECDPARLESALALLPRDRRHCFEFRHPSWFTEAVFRLLADRDAALVIADHPERRFQTLQPTAGWSYVRMHHGSEGRGGGYSERELEIWADRIGRWAERGDVWVYFNNDQAALAVANARRLQQLLTGAAAHGPTG